MVKYKNFILIIFIVLIISSCYCNNSVVYEPSLIPEDIITYIIQDYKFGQSDFVLKYVNNEYVTNELIIDMLADNFTICNTIDKLEDNKYLIEVDNEIKLIIIIIIENNKIQKIRVQDYT